MANCVEGTAACFGKNCCDVSDEDEDWGRHLQKTMEIIRQGWLNWPQGSNGNVRLSSQYWSEKKMH